MVGTHGVVFNHPIPFVRELGAAHLLQVQIGWLVWSCNRRTAAVEHGLASAGTVKIGRRGKGLFAGSTKHQPSFGFKQLIVPPYNRIGECITVAPDAIPAITVTQTVVVRSAPDAVALQHELDLRTLLAQVSPVKPRELLCRNRRNEKGKRCNAAKTAY